MTDAQRSIEIIDVGPRDGLQNEAEILDIDTKVEFIHRLTDAGIGGWKRSASSASAYPDG